MYYTNKVWKSVLQKSLHQPHRVALSDARGNGITFEDLPSLVDTVAEELVRQGIKKSDRVLFLMRPSLESILYFLAIFRVGGVVVVADPAMGHTVFSGRVQHAHPKWILQDPLLRYICAVPFLRRGLRRFGMEIPDVSSFFGMQRIVPLSLYFLRKHAKQTDVQEEMLSDDADAIIVFTSGTTTTPKGVIHTFSSVYSTLTFIAHELSPAPADVFFASQAYFTFIALLAGVGSFIDTKTIFSAERFIENLNSFGVNKVFILPKEGEEIVAYCKKKNCSLPSTLKAVYFGSAPVLVGFLSRFRLVLSSGTRVQCIYGTTELLPISIVSMEKKLAYVGKGDLLGKPVPGVDVRILSDGEIVASGGNLCKTYLQTGVTLTEHHTGDLGRMDSNFELVLLGRKKDMIIKGGHNIYPTLFENTISNIPGVGACAMIGVYDENLVDERIVLCIENISDVPDEKLKKQVKQSLTFGEYSIDSYAWPDTIQCMSIPVSGRSRKIDKTRLRLLVAKQY